MLGFKSVDHGVFLDTEGVSISYVLKSPVFRENDNDGSFIFNTTIPASDLNKKLCKFPMRIEAFRVMTTEVNIEVHFNGVKVWSGLMIAKFARPEEIEVQIALGRGELNYEATDKKISDMVPDENHTVGQIQQVTDPSSGIVHDMVQITGFDEVVTKSYPEVNYAVAPMKVEDLCGSMGEAFNNAYYNTASNINMWDLEQQRFMRPLLTGYQYLLISTVTEEDTHTNHITYLLPYNIFIPLPYNSWVLKNVFNSLGYFIENNIFETDPDLKRLILYNVQSINELKNTNEGPWTQQVSDEENGDYTLTTKRYLYALQPKVQFNLADHVSDVDVKTYLRSLENLFFFRFFIDNKTRKVTIVFLKDIVLSNKYEDITHKVLRISERRMEHDKIAVLKQNFDSNDGNGGFIKTKEEIEEFDRINDVWYQGDLPANSFGQLENKIVYGQMQKKWFVCSSFANDFNHISTWDFFAFEHYCEKKLLESGKDWTTEASAPACSHFVDYKPGTSFVKYAWHLANTKQSLKFYNAYKTNENTCGLRFLFYRGMQKGRMLTAVPTEMVFIATDRYNDLFLYLSAIRWDLESNGGYEYPPSEIFPNLYGFYDVYWENFGGGSYDWHLCKLKNETIYFICDTLLNGTNSVQYVMSVLNGIIGNAQTQHILANYCYITYVNNPTPIITEHLYPYATNDVYDVDTVKIPEANLSLKWDGQYGIYERFAKDYIYWFNNIAKAVTLAIQPTIEDLFTDFSKKKRINGIDYLFDEIRGEIKGDTMSTAEVDAWSF